MMKRALGFGGVDDFFDDVFEITSLSKLLKPFLFFGFTEGIKQGQKQGDIEIEDVFTESVKHALTQKSFEKASVVVGTTKKQLQKEFAEAFENGEGIDQLARRINKLYGAKMGYRAKLIARTELTGVINDGTLQTLIAEGYRRKEWSTVLDTRERESHHNANGQTVGSFETFKVGNSYGQAPGDSNMAIEETANCRCTVLGAGLPQDRKRKLNMIFLRVHGALEKKLVLQLRREFERQRRRILSHFPS